MLEIISFSADGCFDIFTFIRPCLDQAKWYFILSSISGDSWLWLELGLIGQSQTMGGVAEGEGGDGDFEEAEAHLSYYFLKLIITFNSRFA